MKGLLRTRFVRSLYAFVRSRMDAWLDPYAFRSYAQFGEDMILRVILKSRPIGFYVDVGVHHPLRFSNTFFFYERGWRGLNIDAAPGSMDLFRRWRPRDINIEAAVGTSCGALAFYEFNEPALNTFDKALAKERSRGRYHIVRESKIKVKPLVEILAVHLPPGQAIDFLNVDTEGSDLSVLQSNDWERFRPHYVLAESFQVPNSPGRDAVRDYLESLGYQMMASALRTLIMGDRRALMPNSVQTVF